MQVTEHPAAMEVLTASRNHLVRRTAGIQKLNGANAYAVSAAGAEVRLSDGRTVVDLGTWAPSMLGHTHPDVVAAVQRQCETLPTSARGLANSATPLLARRLVELAAPSRLDRVWFGANGADVVEAALKLARVAKKRLGIVAATGGFHGRTLGALSVSDGDHYHDDLEPLLSGVTFVDPSQPVDRHLWTDDTAAVIVEIIQGRGGVAPFPTDSLKRWIDAARRVGALVIIDEIQTGLWRCGAFSLALSLGLDPDALLLGKALGGGVMPLSALLCTSELTAPLETNPMLHSQTFSGHPLACAAGLAALDVLPRLADANTARITAWLTSLADRLARHRDLLTRVRVYGLMMSLEFHCAQDADQFIIAAARAGVLLAPCDIDRTAVRILPPLVIDDQQMATAAAVLDEVSARGVSRSTVPAMPQPRSGRPGETR